MSSEILIDGNRFAVDEEGYLIEFTRWNRAVADELARASGVQLTQAHWEVIDFLREYYAEYHIAPSIRALTKVVGKKLGPEKGNTKYLYDLFPGGPAKEACKIAGLPKPTGCI